MSSEIHAASLSYDEVSFAYPKESELALMDVNIQVDAGELVVFVGPSGCGKSTLLRLAAGLLTPVGGEIRIDGVDASRQSPESRRLGWVPQSYALFDQMTVRQNVEFGPRMKGVSASERRRVVDQMLKLCHIETLQSKSVRALSGGQRQRVAIARALAIRPRALLLDEPLAALDPQLRLAIRESLESLLRTSGVTTLFVTHDQSEALALADKIVVLRSGRVEQIGSPEALWQHPASEFVAEFIGNSHIVSAQPLDARHAQIVPGLTCELNREVGSSSNIRLALSSDYFEVAQEGLASIVSYCEYIGGMYRATVRLGGDEIIPLKSETQLHVGSTVQVAAKRSARVPVVGKL